MLNKLVGIILTAVGSFGTLTAIVFEFFHVNPEGKRTVSSRTMGVILACLLLACIGGATLADYYNEGALVSTPAPAEPSAPLPSPSYELQPSLSLPEETSPTPDVQASEPAETIPSDSQPSESPLESPPPSLALETPPPVPSPTVPPQTSFLLEAFDNNSYVSDYFHLEYRGPNDKEFVVECFPLELPMVPGYYYIKIHRNSTCRELAQASFYVDSSVAGYSIGFRRVLNWELYDIGEVDKDCLLCSWGYRALPTSNLCLTLVDGTQFTAHGLEVRIRCEDFDSDVFNCTYRDEPLWFSLPPDLDYNVTVYFDSFLAAEEPLRLTAPQDGTSPQSIQIQLP